MNIEKLVQQVGPDWAELLKSFMVEDSKGDCPYKEIAEFLKAEKQQQKKFWPEGANVYRAFRESPLASTRVILIGQDPYFKAGYANGIAFGTDLTGKIPVALDKIFEAIEEDQDHGLDLKKPGRELTLVPWAQQGILMLNSALTVRDGEPDSHAAQWEPFTKFLIAEVQKIKRDMIWIAFGARAKNLVKDINPFRNFVWMAEHPTAAARDGNRAWRHNDVFTKTNLIIKCNNLGAPIVW